MRGPLPAPPTDEEKYLYVKANKGFLYSFGVLSTTLLLIGGFLFAFHRPEFIWYGGYLGVVGFYLFISYLVGFISKPFDLETHNDIRAYGKSYEPTVDVFLPCCGEDYQVLRNSWCWVSKLDWPKEKLNIYVLDDGPAAKDHHWGLEDIAHHFGFHYIQRVNRGYLKKAGNIRNAFAQTKAEIILILDADFCPRPDLLRETIPYMKFPKVGILQTPQYFRVMPEQPWIQRGAGTIQELFYRLIQVNRDTFGSSICVGTNALYRRSALEPFGGTYPIEHSEDVHTGFNLLKAGWKIVYIPINLAAGLCPDNIDSFFNQQYRWCSGSTALFLNWGFFWKTKLTIMQRLSFLSGMIYYQATALGVIFVPLPGIVMIWLFPQDLLWYSMMFSVPSLLFGTLHMWLWNRQPYGLSAVRTRQISYYAHLFALWDRFFGHVAEWVPTGVNRGKRGRFRATFISWTVLPPALAYIGSYLHYTPHCIPYLIIITFYLAVNLSCLVDQKS